MGAWRRFLMAILVCAALISTQTVTAEPVVMQQLGSHIQKFYKWKLLIEARVALLKEHLANDRQQLVVLRDNYDGVRAQVNSVLEAMVFEIKGSGYVDLTRYKDDMTLAAAEVELFIEQTGKMIVTPQKAGWLKGVRDAAAFLATLVGLIGDIKELNAKEDTELAVATLEQLMLADFSSIEAVPLSIEAAARDLSGKTELAMQTAQEELELATQRVQGANAQQQLQQVQQQIEQAQQALEQGDFQQAQQWLEQANEPIQHIAQAGEQQQPEQQQAQQEEQVQVAEENPLAAMPASDVIGTEVQNTEGATVAEIVDLVKRQGEEDLYAVLSVGGFLGIGDKEVVVPISELVLSQEGQIVYADATEEQLKEMPEYHPEELYDSAIR